MLELNVSVEILFCESIQIMAENYLNSYMFYRILDIGFALIEEGIEKLNLAIILAILKLNEDYLVSAKNYTDLIDKLQFCS